ncbi:MAG: methyltransferase domain-containing protein [Nitrospinae bacterium]|nr:methyltransferase domain-containing protein [Nitrospinota bacterium]
METRRSLDLGCGRAKTPGFVGVDKFRDTQADVVADVDAPHLPFADSTFDEVAMTDSLEHVEDVAAAVTEIGRILKPGGELRVRVPHFSSLHAYSDFTHKHFFSMEGVKHLAGGYGQYGHYSVKGFRIKSIRLNLWGLWRVLGVEWLANRFPLAYEKLFAFSFPAMSMEFCLTIENK